MHGSSDHTDKTVTTHRCAHAEDSHNPQLCARRRQPQSTAVRTQKTATTHSCAHAEDSHNPQLCARRRQPQPTAVRTQKTATTHSCAHAALGRMARYTYLIRSLRLQRRSEVGCAIHRHGGACTPQKMANHNLASELASLLALTPRDACPYAQLSLCLCVSVCLSIKTSAHCSASSRKRTSSAAQLCQFHV
jgi:hypothetical protein